MTGGTKAALELGAIVLLPTIAGILILGSIINKVAEAIDGAQVYLEDAVRTEVSHWTTP